MYINTESIVELENFRSAFGMIRARSGQNLIGMMLNLLSLLMQTGRSPQTSACFSFPLSQLPSKIASVSKTSPACYFPSGFMWRRSRNSWPAENCVMSKNPLSERSELWIFVNDLSSFRQALVFRSAATESPEGACARGVHENQTILFPASGLNLLLSYSSTLLIGTLTNLLYSFFPCKVLIYPQI